MKLRVGYLDDEEMLLEMIQDLYSTDEIEIHSFSQVEIFLQTHLSHPFDVVLLDFRMPKMTGDQVAEKLPKDTPKLLLTGELEMKENPLFDKILFKPLDSDLVQSTLDGYLQRKKAAAETKAS